MDRRGSALGRTKGTNMVPKIAEKFTEMQNTIIATQLSLMEDELNAHFVAPLFVDALQVGVCILYSKYLLL